MKTQELRDRYLKFFESKGHKILKSASLVPGGDQTLLLTAAGMVPFKPYFMGIETPDYKRVATCQKCIRTPDLENVGKTARHGTFFEMLGNFSFGDYFKKEAIEWAWEFVTKEMGFDPKDIWITIYLDDDEARDIWRDVIGVPEERIVRKGKADNFWEIGVGPCGPCSEIHIDRGANVGCNKEDCNLDCGCDRFMEIWNLVFIQFFKDENGEYTPLKNKGIDTGMGLERIAALLQGVPTIFDADETKKIRDYVCELANVKYGDDYVTDVAIRVITDHARSSTFMVSDGIFPTNEGRGYVLRRILRRGMRYGRLLKISDKLMTKVAKIVIDTMKTAYPELEADKERILKTISLEEERFEVALEQGTSLLGEIIEDLITRNEKTISGLDAFKLYDTFGFPYELTLDVAEEAGMSVDKESFDKAMADQRTRARAARGENTYVDEKATFYKKNIGDMVVEFTGYIKTRDESVVKLIVKDASIVKAIKGDKVEVVTEKTPFYGEGGGQTSDLGIIRSNKGLYAKVVGIIKPLADCIVHEVEIVEGELNIGDEVVLEVDTERRSKISRSHTSTHLLHAALRNILGEHVQQAGSLVEPNKLRFDFTHFEAMNKEDKNKVEMLVNQWVFEGNQVTTTQMPISEAKENGAMALFSEKYKDNVRVVEVKGRSIELCGGTHVLNTSEIGLFKITSEGGIASGVRRIEAVVSSDALDLLNDSYNKMAIISDVLKVEQQKVVEKVEKTLVELKEYEKEISKLKAKLNAGGLDELIGSSETVNGMKLVTTKLDGANQDVLRDIADKIRERIQSGVVILGTRSDDKLSFLVALTKDAVSLGLHAGNIAKEMALAAGGGGGGRPDIAISGGKDVTKLDEALSVGSMLVKEKLSN